MNKKATLLLALALLVGWQANAVVHGTSASTRICVDENGRTARRPTCGMLETELASNKVMRTNVVPKRLKSGRTRFSARAKYETEVPGEQTLVGAVGQSVRSYTYAMTFEDGWTGKVQTSCGPYEVFIGGYGSPYLNGKPLPTVPAFQGDIYYDGGMVMYQDLEGNDHFQMAQGIGNPKNFVVSAKDNLAEDAWPFIDQHWMDGLILYGTLVCAPLTELVPE